MSHLKYIMVENLTKHDWLEALYLLNECEKTLNSVLNEAELPAYYKDCDLDAFVEEYGISHLQLLVHEFLKLHRQKNEK